MGKAGHETDLHKTEGRNVFIMGCFRPVVKLACEAATHHGASAFSTMTIASSVAPCCRDCPMAACKKVLRSIAARLRAARAALSKHKPLHSRFECTLVCISLTQM